VQVTRFGGPEVMDVVDLPDPVPGNGEQLLDSNSSSVGSADGHLRMLAN
jgi:NADPH2:quinone reductase